MINTILEINGVQYNEAKTMEVKNSLATNGMASSFRIVFDSPFGRYDNEFTIGTEVLVYAAEDDPTPPIIFAGPLEEIKFEGEANTQTVTLRGRDYSARLQDLKVAPVVYTNSEISTIVKDIVANETTDISTVNVDVTSIVLPRIAFNQLSL